jgi:hypothetical protein
MSSFRDLTGQHFGMLTVVEKTDERQHGRFATDLKKDGQNVMQYLHHHIKR